VWLQCIWAGKAVGVGGRELWIPSGSSKLKTFSRSWAKLICWKFSLPLNTSLKRLFLQICHAVKVRRNKVRWGVMRFFCKLEYFGFLKVFYSTQWSPNSNSNCINAGTTADFGKRSAMRLPKLYRTLDSLRATFRIFLLDSRTLSYVCRSPKPLVITNQIDFGVKHYRILNSNNKFKVKYPLTSIWWLFSTTLFWRI
jgi:hypothetical protein